jgi:hypothetical protein
MGEDICENNFTESLRGSGFKESDLKVETFQEPGPKGWILFFVLFGATLFTTYLAGGVLYAGSLFFILGIHEFGHFLLPQKNAQTHESPV